MNKTSVLRAPSWAHQGEFLANGTIWMFAGCYEVTSGTGAAESTSLEGMTYVQDVHYLTQIASAAVAQDQTAVMYLAYKFPTDDDYLERNGLSYQYITSGEGVIGLKMIPGVRIQEYIGTDYTNTSGVKMGALAPLASWALTHGDLLYFTNSGQFTNVTDNKVPRAQFIEKKGDWVTIEFIGGIANYGW